MDRLSLTEIYNRNQTDLAFLLEKMKNKEEAPFFISSLKFNSLENALYHWFVEADLDKAKNEFYKIATVTAYNYERYSGEFFTVLDTFTYPILSDNEKIIETYMGYKNSELNNLSSSFSAAIQATLINKKGELKRQIDALEEFVKTKTWEKNYSGIPLFFKGILSEDKNDVEQGILKVIADHDKQDHYIVAKKYINIIALALAKIAYRKGISVEIDNSLLPEEMVPVKQLEKYETYEFLR